MKKAQRIIAANGEQAELAKILRGLAHRFSLHEVFADFVAAAAIALSNSCDWRQFAAREKEFNKLEEKYGKEGIKEFAKGLAIVCLALQRDFQDFLGSLFMLLELGNSWRGQFFTPYSVSKMMAEITMSDVDAKLTEQGFVTVLDPCIGGGAMIIAAADALAGKGIDYTTAMHVSAIDIDIKAVHMAYVQFCALGIPATVYHGNALDPTDVRSVWRTPAHFHGAWDEKLAGYWAKTSEPGHESEAGETTQPVASVQEVESPMSAKMRKAAEAGQMALF